MKKAMFYIFMVIIVIFAVAATAEIALRIKGLFDRNVGLKQSMGDINTKYLHAFRPNTSFRLVASKKGEYDVGVRINNYGFRGRDITMKKSPGVFRIMAIGDSFTFGVGAETDRTIPALLEKDLRERGMNVEVINAGFGNYSPILHYLKMRDEYLEFEPDLVLYFYDFSDLADDWRCERHAVRDRKGEIVRIDPTYIDGKRDWWSVARIHSKLCAYIHNKLIRTIDKIRVLGLKRYIKTKLSGRRAKALIVTEAASEDKVDPITYDGYLMIRGRDRLTDIKKHFEASEKYLNLMRDMLARRSTPMILVIYPYGIHVGPDQWGEGRVYWGFDKGKVYDDYYAFDILEDYAHRNDVKCVNLLPQFLKHKREHLFFDVDGHFTPRANEIAAQALADVVAKEKKVV